MEEHRLINSRILLGFAVVARRGKRAVVVGSGSRSHGATASSTTKLAPLAPAQSRCMETIIYMGVSIDIPAAGADMLSP